MYLSKGIDSLNVKPVHYRYLFPPQIDQNKIHEMVTEGIFPTLSGLAPAITFFLLLSGLRLFLQKLVIKVSMTTLIRNSAYIQFIHLYNYYFSSTNYSL